MEAISGLNSWALAELGRMVWRRTGETLGVERRRVVDVEGAFGCEESGAGEEVWMEM